ncbi:hypothetical protein [Streptomyces sp. cmx-4-9]|uniref:hypothetical protein n=1 Tax=Streptomyces sp. cmx-4-9 TaxID=2790941 RepID=UPI003980A67A
MDRRTAAAALIGAALLTGTAACTAGGAGAAPAAAGPERTAGASPDRSPGWSGGPSPTGAPGPTTGQLQAFVLAPGAKAGRYEVSVPLFDEPFSEAYEAAPQVCTPLTTLGRAGHTGQAYAKVQVPGEWQEVDTDVLLRSYPGDGAAAAMRSLAEAGRQCAGGYTEDRAVVEGRVTGVTAVPAPALGDEALSFRIVVQDVKEKDVSLYKYLTVVRSGAVTLSFRSDILDVKDFGGVPAEVVAAQWEKFAQASGAGS